MCQKLPLAVSIGEVVVAQRAHVHRNQAFNWVSGKLGLVFRAKVPHLKWYDDYQYPHPPSQVIRRGF